MKLTKNPTPGAALLEPDMRQFDCEDLTAEYHRGLAEGRAQGLKMAEEACMALERKKWEVFATVSGIRSHFSPPLQWSQLH